MTYKHTSEGELLKLTFEGDLIGENNGPELIELINNSLNEGMKFCIIDISEVRYINSSGIGVLITILTKFRNKGGELYIVKPSEHVRKLLIITKLQAIFNIVESEEEAIKTINN